MPYRVTFDYRAAMPRSWKDAKPWRLVACHWTAGAPGYNGAIGTLNYLLNTADSKNASYHELWAYDEPSDDFRVIRIVPTSHCAHSLNPHQPPNGPYDPDTWVREALGGNWWDPNQGVYAVSIAGAGADCRRYAANPKFVGHAIRRLNEIRGELPDVVGIAEHFRFQTNKSDWGPELTPKLGGLRFVTEIPDTALEGAMNVIKDVVRFSAPRRFTIRPAVDGSRIVNGFDGRSATAAKSKDWGDQQSGANAAAVVTISGDASPGDYRFIEVIDGYYAGLYVPAHSVNMDTAPDTGVPQAAYDAALQRAEKIRDEAIVGFGEIGLIAKSKQDRIKSL